MPRSYVIEPVENHYEFPPSANYLMPGILVLVLLMGVAVPTLLVLGFSPATTDVGYEPAQPVPFSHAQHAGELQIDCRYCHSTVEQTAFAAVPPTQTCMNCHATIKADSPNLQAVRDSYTQGTPLAWKKVHDLPDYTYFNHAVHVNRGVGCVTCHGHVDQMQVVRQDKPLSMAWCLDCHRNPSPHLRPIEEVTNMAWEQPRDLAGADGTFGENLMKRYQISGPDYMTSCSTCHR